MNDKDLQREYEQIGARIRNARIEQKMSQADLAAKANISLPHISSIELGKTKMLLESLQHEYPSPYAHYRIGVYIRFFNQTRYENYLLFHKQEFIDTISLCPNWTLVGFYVDEGQTAPYMENAREWSRLLQDCLDGKIDLIITQKVSNVTRDPNEITLIARVLATQHKPIGIYFVNEDIFTLASYYQTDMREQKFFPSPDWQMLPDDQEEGRRDLLE